MRVDQYYIRRKLLLIFLGGMFFLSSSKALAQDDDTTVIYSDSSSVDNWEEEDYQNKPGKYSADVIFRSVPDTTVARMQREKEFAYANDPEYWVKEKQVRKKAFWDYLFDFFASDTVRVIFYILIGALILFVLYRIIVVNDLFIFNSSRKNALQSQEAIVSKMDPTYIDNQIRDAIEQKQFNVAIRYLYLKTLYVLNDKKHIEFHAEATNTEYLNQMSHHKRFADFRFLTKVYEYVWYGKFDINEQQFLLVQNHFKNFQAAI